MNTLTVTDLSVHLAQGRTLFQALAPTSLTLDAGQSLAVTGRSGSGKTTLANAILGLLPASSGRVEVEGKLWADPHTRPSRTQRHLVQSIPQDAQASFVPRWTIGRSLEHAAARLRPGADTASLVSRALELAHFDRELLARRPHQISGGQAQRAAIARALVAQPKLLIADEPTSALDTQTAQSVIDSLLTLTQQTGAALLVVTHDPQFAARCDRIHTLTTPALVSEHH